MAAWGSLHSLLDYECLLFYCDEWRAKNHLRLNDSTFFRIGPLMNALSFITRGEPTRDHYLQQFFCNCVYSLQLERAYRTVAQQLSYSSQYLLRVWDDILYFKLVETDCKNMNYTELIGD
jgi:hypothetical protein